MKPSFSAEQLRPYIRAAESFIKANNADRYIQWSLDRIAAMLRGAGPVRSIGDFPLLSPRDKARASLAMLREKPVPVSRILAVTLGVCCATEEDTYGPGGDGRLFQRVQIAKALRRRASGSHVVYETGARFDRYPPSTGRFLAVMGAMLEDACDFALYERLKAVLELKQSRFGALHVAYLEVGQPPPENVDLYDITGDGLHREGWKQLTNALLLSEMPFRNWPEGARRSFPPETKLRDAVAAIRNRHAPIAHLFGSGLGIRLMWKESAMLVESLLQLFRRGVTALPLHDSVLCAVGDAPAAEATMREVFANRTGGARANIKISTS